jgi:acetyl-CoA synthetase
MRRLLRGIAEHRQLGDVTALADPTVVNLIEDKLSDKGGSEEG